MASVAQRGDRWRARFRDLDGVEHARHFDTKKAGAVWLAEQQVLLARGAWVDPAGAKVSFEKYARWWVRTQPCRPSTLERRRSIVERHLVPRFGRFQLGALPRREINSFVRELEGTLAAGTVRNVIKVLAAIYNTAIEDQVVAVSPVKGVKLPPVDTDITIPTRDEIDALFGACPSRYRISISLAAGAGLRSGEVRGLTVDRVDFLRRRLLIDRQLVTTSTGSVLGPVKTRHSNRTVPVASWIVDDLAHHVEQHHLGAGDLLLTNEWGMPIARQRWTEIWRRVQRDAGVKVRFHDLRHWCASSMLSDGVPVPQAAKMLGHTPAVLLSTYAHVLEGDDDRARAAMERAFADQVRTRIR